LERRNGLIGEGSNYGKVFEAHREDFGETYTAAIKFITIPQNQSEVINARDGSITKRRSVTAYFRGLVEEIVREFKLMSKLKGTANVVSYEDHGSSRTRTE
jgi:serine/threonine protein kinase